MRIWPALRLMLHKQFGTDVKSLKWERSIARQGRLVANDTLSHVVGMQHLQSSK